MQMHNLPTLFDESHFTQDDLTYLAHKERHIKNILLQSADEIGGELEEVRQWFADNHKWGFEDWVNEKFGFSPEKARQLMTVHRRLSGIEGYNYNLLDFSFNAQLQLAKAPDPQAAVDEALLRQQIEGELTAKKAKEIAEYQRAERIARDEARSIQERAAALDRQLAYVKQQLASAQQAAQQPKVVEKIVEKEVVPHGFQIKENGLRDQISRLQERERALARERDSYRKQLDEERAVAYARRVESREGENAERIRVMFAEATRDYLRSTRVFLSRLPSVSDTQAFEADDWHRLDEAIQAHEALGRELQKIKNTVSSSSVQQSFVIDAAIVDAVSV
jgi:hypothetical protein